MTQLGQINDDVEDAEEDNSNLNKSILEEKNNSFNESKKDKLNNLKTELMISYFIYSKFSSYMDIKYNYDNDLKKKNLQSELDKVFLIGINYASKDLEASSTSSSLLFDGKKPRHDVWLRLATIAHVLFDQECYPIFKKNHLKRIVKEAIEQKDDRTIKKYLNCIMNYSKINRINGVIDVKNFYGSIPAKYRNQTEYYNSLFYENL